MNDEKHTAARVRHLLLRRTLVVRRKEQLTPHMLRLVLGGEQLAGFVSLAADDHLKVFVPAADGGEQRRDYTPRHYDAATNELTVDFALHEGGPVTAWAKQVQPGDRAEIGGPRGSFVVPDDFDWWLLVGDETALPAIGRRVEELSAKTQVISLVAVAGPAEEQRFAARPHHEAHWVHRPLAQASDAAPLLTALRSLTLPRGEGFVWMAGEANVVRALRRHVADELRHPPAWSKASGYWTVGRADSAEKF